MNILVVDDCPTTRRDIISFLRALGFVHIEQADDGLTALPMLVGRSCDFLITDENMPGMRGLDLLRAVRSDPKLARLPVLMVTIESREDFIREAVGAGVDAYIVKPFSVQTLERRINEIFYHEAATA